MSADFISFAIPMADADGVPLAAALLTHEREFNGNVYVGADIESRLEHDATFAMSPNYPVLVAIDRFSTRPPNVRFLDRHAVRFVSNAELAEFRAAWERLLAAAGGRERLVAVIAPHLDRHGNGTQDVRNGIEALEGGLRKAEAEGVGLLIACVPT